MFQNEFCLRAPTANSCFIEKNVNMAWGASALDDAISYNNI